MSANKMQQMLDFARHPRAAVIIHDLLMVAVAWVASSWLIEKIGGVSSSAVRIYS